MNLVITGTSSGIGQVLAQHFVASGHGVWGLARRPQPAIDRFRTGVCDVGDRRAVEQAAIAIAAQWPHVDGLICCAGTQGAIGPAMTVPPDHWAATVHATWLARSSLSTPFSLHYSVVRAARKSSASVAAARRRPGENFSAYGVAKTGIVRLVETLAVEWRKLPLDINAVAPGAINTAMTEQIVRASAAAGEKEAAAALKQLETGGQSLDKVIGLVEFLLSPESDTLSGKLLSAQWDDWKNFPARREELVKSDIYTLRRITENTRP